MVIWFFTLFTPFTSLANLVARSISAALFGLAAQCNHTLLRGDRGIEGAGRAVIQQRHLDLGGDGSVINLFAYRLRLFRGLCHGHLIIYVFNPFDILGVFSRQILLCLAGRFASQGHDSVFDVNLGRDAAHVAMKQERGFHFRHGAMHPSLQWGVHL